MSLKLLPPNSPLLRQTAIPVKKFDGRLRDVATAMNELMSKQKAVGLASIQVGILENIIIIGTQLQKNGPKTTVMCNARILEAQGTQPSIEYCLSVPGYRAELLRPLVMEVEYQDLTGKKHRIIVQDLGACVVSHELDHQKGLLIKDYKDNTG